MWALALVGLIAATAVFLYLRRPDESAPAGSRTGSADAVPGAPAARGPLGPAVEPREVPPIDLADPFVRELLRGLSSRPELAQWLAGEGLIRNLVVSIDAVAQGATPAPRLRRLAPAEAFTLRPRGDDIVIDPRTYTRYDGIADTVAALDAAGLARAYATLRPRLQEAYQELGYPTGNIDDAVERGIVRLLTTPVIEGEIEVRQAPVLYQFADVKLERLAPAQKQLLRMGPRNTRVVQEKLRELARELGIPPERLPAAAR
jgi:Protein of unknown function (DUF3014)